MSSRTQRHTFLLGIHIIVESLGHRTCICAALVSTVKSFPKSSCWFILPQAIHEHSNCSKSLPTFDGVYFILAISAWYLTAVLIRIFLMINGLKNLFIYLLAIGYPLLRRTCSSLWPFKNWVVFSYWFIEILYIFNTGYKSFVTSIYLSITIIICHSMTCFF